ncbi:hypothetical protein TWF225_012096 [Orbilia oligospora]|nr:hypothetical protein TWF225_012096 [Orbilia oligospora]KAF3242946.1 hypothetical protein TWF128_012103 [Orbilia oligospora]KAF3242947.1 hypothetical protein TWF128_012103 [Orbilia oligospora]KAF3260387.1 hypothetical protein TWF217_012082 [Orbilia oligospora]
MRRHRQPNIIMRVESGISKLVEMFANIGMFFSTRLSNKAMSQQLVGIKASPSTLLEARVMLCFWRAEKEKKKTGGCLNSGFLHCNLFKAILSNPVHLCMGCALPFLYSFSALFTGPDSPTIHRHERLICLRSIRRWKDTIPYHTTSNMQLRRAILS